MTFVAAFPTKIVIFSQIQRLRFIRVIAESVKTYDSVIARKTIFKIFLDLVLGSDSVIARKTIFKIFLDLVLGSDSLNKALNKAKSIFDLVLVNDILSKVSTTSIRDSLYDIGYVIKIPTINKYDSWYIVEIVTKIMYILMQKNVRRVYFLPPEYTVWRDIILASDHNTKVLVCRAFLDAFKNVRDMLFAKRISTSDSCIVSDSIEVEKT